MSIWKLEKAMVKSDLAFQEAATDAAKRSRLIRHYEKKRSLAGLSLLLIFLAFFLPFLVNSFIAIADLIGDGEQSNHWRLHSEGSDTFLLIVGIAIAVSFHHSDQSIKILRLYDQSKLNFSPNSVDSVT